MRTIVIATGGFDPVHRGHIEYFQEAATFGELIIGLNSDEWLVKKKGKNFMDWDERAAIIKEFRSVTDVIDFEDDEGGTACGAIKKVHEQNPDAKIYFANGGDRTQGGDSQVSAEEILCAQLGIDNIYGVGKSGKIQSSSELLARWKKFEEQNKLEH